MCVKEQSCMNSTILDALACCLLLGWVWVDECMEELTISKRVFSPILNITGMPLFRRAIGRNGGSIKGKVTSETEMGVPTRRMRSTRVTLGDVGPKVPRLGYQPTHRYITSS